MYFPHAPELLVHQPQQACNERAQAMPKQGSSSRFKYGRAVGAIETTIMLRGIPLEIVESSDGSGIFICTAMTKNVRVNTPRCCSPALAAYSRGTKTITALRRSHCSLASAQMGSVRHEVPLPE